MKITSMLTCISLCNVNANQNSKIYHAKNITVQCQNFKLNIIKWYEWTVQSIQVTEIKLITFITHTLNIIMLLRNKGRLKLCSLEFVKMCSPCTWKLACAKRQPVKIVVKLWIQFTFCISTLQRDGTWKLTDK